jgi:spermidine synthase
MTEQNTNPPSSLPASRRYLPLLLVLFAGSGCAALIYEIVWLQLLQLVIGSTAVSMAVLLGTYMGGMCLGSLALPRLISTHWHPLRVYALIELGIGILGIVVLSGMPFVVRFYTANAGHGLLGILLRGAVSAICLLLPTMLMGATLPAIARWVETTPRGVSWLGFLYGTNTGGAVVGCLLAGFYLLRVRDMATATYVAVAINGIVAVLGLGLSIRAPYRAPSTEPGERVKNAIPARRSVYLAIALSGLCALGAEVVWTRLLSLMLGATVYTFSIILAVFLAGLGIGSGFGSALSRGKVQPRVLLGYCQFFLAAAIAWTATMLARSLPYWPINPALAQSPSLIFQVDFIRCLWAILPAACLWGASFPLALAAAASPGQDGGRLVGRIYASNTVGAIVGAVGFSLVVIPAIGTQQAQRLMIGLSAAAGLVMFIPLFRPFLAGVFARGTPQSSAFKFTGAASLAVATGLAICLAWSVPRTPWELIAYGRYLPTKTVNAQVLYAGEGLNASFAVTELEGGIRNFHVSGRVEASSDATDMRIERMLGHIPGLFHPEPKSVLVVGCGAGVTAGSFVLYPSVKRIVICEIEPLIPRVVARYFGPENYDVLDDPRVEVVYDDARHYILTTSEKFDIITTDPIHPWIKGSATLYTKEFFDVCKAHLNPDGIMALWVPFYESTLVTVKSEMATFFDIFPDGTIWSNDIVGQGYDSVVVGRLGRPEINLDELEERLDRPDYQAIRQSLVEIGFKSAVQMLATYAGQAPDLRTWLKGAEINRDRNLRLQYLAGLGLNSYLSGFIFNDLVSFSKFPEQLFVGSEKNVQALRTALGKSK